MKPDKSILKKIKAYDRRLSLQWNSRNKYWELYYRAPTGNKLITPIVEGLYITGASFTKAVHLDNRLIDFLSRSDGNRAHKNWKWIGRKRFDERESLKHKKRHNHLMNIAKDNYNLVNESLLNPYVRDVSSWLKPDVKTATKRISYRSAENAREYLGRE